MTRIMGDATHAAVDIAAGYDTGTRDIQWTAGDWARYPNLPHVHIDQGGPGAPAYAATVIDVETFAYTPADVPAWIARSTAPRPTVYCNRSNLAQVLAT